MRWELPASEKRGAPPRKDPAAAGRGRNGMKKTIGIVGGMGPLATADLLEKMIRSADAAADQQHAHIIADCNTDIPDRTAAILSGGEDPLPQLVRSCMHLEAAGANVLVMACNTAHYFYDRLQPFINVPMLHMPRETAKRAHELGDTRCALLATDGTVRAGIYDKAFAAEGIELLKPDAEGQRAVMDMIYSGVKAGRHDYDTAAVHRALDSLKAQGAQAFILGCTELPIAFADYGFDEETIDPTQILAEAALHAVGMKVKERQA